MLQGICVYQKKINSNIKRAKNTTYSSTNKTLYTFIYKVFLKKTIQLFNINEISLLRANVTLVLWSESPWPFTHLTKHYFHFSKLSANSPFRIVISYPTAFSLILFTSWNLHPFNGYRQKELILDCGEAGRSGWSGV